MKLMRLLLTALVSWGAITACSLVPEAETVSIYHLSLPASEATQATTSYRLRVNEPQALQTLNTHRISVYTSAQEQAYIRNVRWADRAPVVVQQALVDGLREGDLFALVSADTGSGRHDLHMNSQLRQFAVHQYGDTRLAQVTLDVQIVQMPAREVIAHTRLQQQVEVERDGTAAGVSALGQAMGAVNDALLQWLAAQLAD